MVANESDTTKTEATEKYLYLVGTNHLDPDDGLLYKATSVEAKLYRDRQRILLDSEH